MRLTYALGWIGDRRQRAVEALVRSLDSSDIGLRIEAVSALGRIGNATVFPRLEKLVRDIHEDENVRGNACIAIGRLGDSSAEGVLRDAARDVDDFVVLCAEEGLRLLRNGGADRR
jgi:HEAT repeat protein